MAEVPIKNEPDAPMASGAEDDDIYEDAGDLEFYTDGNNPNANQFANMYLFRVGKALYDVWSKLDDDEEITIGHIRQWYEPLADGSPGPPRMKFRLADNIPGHQPIPKEYNLNISTGVQSTYLFSEKNLDGFKSKSSDRNPAATEGIPFSILKPKPEKVDKPKYDKRQKFVPFYRKAIPKKTKIIGKVSYDLSCAPSNPEEQKYLLAMHAHETGKTTKVEIINKRQGEVINIGTNRAANWETNLIKAPAKPVKAKGQDLKAARIPENELLDLLFRAFERYQYWSMKTLRHDTKQPEAYLRTTLEKIAVLNKTGRFANLWSLRPENVRNSAKPEEMAPEFEGEEDDDMLMEDVL
ncbi:transcription initiation factor TFIIF subunit beta [Ceratocystis lukuohia]|uniref:Transcription initiation factor IIF subunit beta n=3 Tax=Ceratocystis TaxID=5157 RepID=A0A0F8DNV3_CERFI|nr:Transcription initiation factor IIF subunit beta [Ceratocystis platani]PHH49802.1 Transcription initiation factor IIF subunit beta [Ceratocystis fimbriata CBS 114723]